MRSSEGWGALYPQNSTSGLRTATGLQLSYSTWGICGCQTSDLLLHDDVPQSIAEGVVFVVDAESARTPICRCSRQLHGAKLHPSALIPSLPFAVHDAPTISTFFPFVGGTAEYAACWSSKRSINGPQSGEKAKGRGVNVVFWAFVRIVLQMCRGAHGQHWLLVNRQ